MQGISSVISTIDARIDRALVNHELSEEARLYVCSELIELKNDLLIQLDEMMNDINGE
jgi:hypothetical protein